MRNTLISALIRQGLGGRKANQRLRRSEGSVQHGYGFLTDGFQFNGGIQSGLALLQFLLQPRETFQQFARVFVDRDRLHHAQEAV